MMATPWLLLGLAGGTAHFALLLWNTRLYVADSGVLPTLTLQMLRMVLTALILLFGAWHGAVPLLLCAVGIMLGRSLVLNGTAKTA